MCNKNCKCVDENKYLFAKEMCAHYKELFDSSVNELRFYRTSRQQAMNVLEETLLMLSEGKSNDIVSRVIGNGIDRIKLDFDIHNNSIAEGNESFENDNIEQSNDGSSVEVVIEGEPSEDDIEELDEDCVGEIEVDVNNLELLVDEDGNQYLGIPVENDE